MNKNTLDKGVNAFIEEIREALQTFYDALNPGQQKQILKNKKVKEKCDLYGVEYEK